LTTTGDGVADDTDALTNAMMLGPRCLGQYNPTAPCQSSTITPAIVYIPPGTYRLFSAVVMPYNTIVIGDALNMPTLLADSTFQGIGLLDPDPYYSGGASWYANQNDFYRQVRNIIFDITQMPIGAGHCIHWQVAQATSLQNLVFNMAVGGGSNNMQMGIFMDNGSGGFMRDLVFNGGGTCFLLGYVYLWLWNR
jgi:glucan 1,3-beta-glucosidase